MGSALNRVGSLSPGQPQAELHPAAASQPAAAAPDQAQAVRAPGSGQEHPAGVPEVRHPAEPVQEEEDEDLQPVAPPQLPHRLQARR